jgi:glycine/D-amino acid oxidase-like deaminating enzyme
VPELPYTDLSPWIAPPEDPQPPLAGSRRADVAVIGAGYTGLSAALSLRAEGAAVTVLEQDFAGAGASGRNAGHLTPTIGKDLPTLLRWFGRERARALVRFADHAVEHTEDLIARLRIRCGYLPAGNVLAAVHPKQEARLRAAAELARSLGGHVRFLAAGEMRERALPGAFLCGVLEERGGTLDPGRYVRGLRRAALDAGVVLCEGSRVLACEDGRPLRVRSAGGELRADHVVIATNAYPVDFFAGPGWRRRALVPLRVSLFETAPIDAERLAALGWSGREGIYTAHEILESYRLTARGTIVGGSKVVRYAWGGALPPGRDERAFRAIEAALRRRFPTLAGVPVACFWGGWIGLTPDFLPLLGSAGAGANVHFGLAYAGHGVAQATLVGAMLADRVRGKPHALEPALARRTFAWPPEPLRFALAKLLNATLSLLDARTG